MLKTPVISYNLKERGRHFRGKNRHYDIPAIVRAINSPETQERIKNRDMLGFYGHWVRIKFGLDPTEGGIDKGRAIAVEPAIVTTFLEAYPDGTVKHAAEFLDTDSGKVAQKLFESKTGGFSSAIDERRPTFYGFDYVLEPNYSTNRGYTLDSVQDMTADDIEAAIYGEQVRGLLKVLDSVNAERDAAATTIEHLREENEQLLSLLSQEKGIEPHQIRFDSIAPVVSAIDPAEQMRRDAELFRAVRDLPRVQAPEPKSVKALSENPLYARLLNGFR